MQHTLKVIVSMIVLAQPVTHEAIAASPEDQIKFRQSNMMVMRWNMGKIKNQVNGDATAYNREQVIAAANVIAAIANAGMNELFGPETATGKGWTDTKIKPEYFNEPIQVKERSDKFVREANELVKVANAAETSEVKTQFNRVFESCKACHKDYREKLE